MHFILKLVLVISKKHGYKNTKHLMESKERSFSHLSFKISDPITILYIEIKMLHSRSEMLRVILAHKQPKF